MQTYFLTDPHTTIKNKGPVNPSERPQLTVYLVNFELLLQRFSNCGPRTTSGPRVLPLWSF